MTRPPDPVGLYEPFCQHGRLVALSAISSALQGQLITGKVGRDIDFGTAQEAARRAAGNLVAVLMDAVAGDDSRIEGLLLVRGYVNAAEDSLGPQDHRCRLGGHHRAAGRPRPPCPDRIGMLNAAQRECSHA